MDVTIYHNTNCSNSRGCLALLKERGITPTVVEYVKAPLSAAALKALASALQKSAGAAWPGLREGMMRTKEPLYAELALADVSDSALIAAMARHPALMNRP